MNYAEVSVALKERVLAVLGDTVPIMFPNEDYEVTTKPYWVVNIIRTATTNPHMRGSADPSILRGRIVATLVTRQGRSTYDSDAQAQVLADGFPPELRLPVAGGGLIEFIKPADVMEGYPQDGDWRTPVLVDFQANA